MFSFWTNRPAGLTPVAIREVHQMIEGLSHRGRTVFLCTHNLAEAERLCDRVAVLAQGRRPRHRRHAKSSGRQLNTATG